MESTMVKVASPSSLPNRPLLGDTRTMDLSGMTSSPTSKSDGVNARIVGEQRSRSNSSNSSERRRRHQARLFEKSRSTSIAGLSPTPPITYRKTLGGGGSSPRYSDSEQLVNQSLHSSTSSSFMKERSSSTDVTAEDTTFSSSANNTPDNSFQIRRLPRSASSSPTQMTSNGGLVQSESSDPMIITGCPLDEHHTTTRISPCTLKYENCTPKTNNVTVVSSVGDPGKMIAKSPPSDEHQATTSSHNVALSKLKKKKTSTAKVAAVPSSEDAPLLTLPSTTTTSISSSPEIKKTRLAPRSRQRSQSLWGDDATSSKTSSTEHNQKASIKKVPTAPMLSSLSDEPSSSLTTPLLKPKQPQHHHHHTQQQSQSAKVSKSKVKTLTPSRRPKPDLLRRHATAPTLSSSLTSSPARTKQHHIHHTPLSHYQSSTNVVDDVLTDRAFIIRQNLMNYEMQELALAAEKAADSGLEKFVGNPSKFGVQSKTSEHRNPTNKVFDDEDFNGHGMHGSSSTSNTNNELLMTPSRRKYIEDNITTSSAIISTPAGVVSHAMGMDLQYTPSSYYFARKKIPVTQLRDFGEIVPNFMEMHTNIRHQLGNEGVDREVLPEVHGRRSLMKNDTDDTPNVYEEEGGNGGNKGGEEWEGLSHAPSIAASHASSFSSYAVTSLASLKDVIEYVNWPSRADNNKSAANNEIRPSMSMPTHASQSKQQQQHGLRDIEQCTSLRSVPSSQDPVDLIPTVRRTSVTTKPPIRFKPAIATTNSDDSDDSSVEFYGRRSPINTDLSNQSFASNKTENLGMAPWRQQQQQQHQVIRSAASVSSDIIPTTTRKSVLQNRVNSRRKKKNPASVSFETEKAGYQALLDRMQNNSPNNNSKKKTNDTSVDVDQRSCAASLTHIDLDILPSSSNLSTKSTPMANFLSKIQNQFSRTRSNSMEIGQKTSKATDEENKQFVANFFYTSKDSNGILEDEDGGISPSTLKINPEHHSRDPYCLPGGCGANDLISACESATKYADLLFDWVGVKDKTKKNANRIIDPNGLSDSATSALNPKWMTASWRGTVSGKNESEKSLKSSRVYTPPRLSVRHAEQYQENDVFCSPESTVGNALGGDECGEDTIIPTCPEFQDATACDPETNIVCSPE